MKTYTFYISAMRIVQWTSCSWIAAIWVNHRIRSRQSTNNCVA